MKFKPFPPGRFTLFAVILLALALSARETPAAEEPSAVTKAKEPVRVLVLGAYHFGNPGQDIHNMKAVDMLTPEKQAELGDLAERLARFAPTKIAVEAVSKRPDLVYEQYEAFTPEMLLKNANERVQIGFRLARRLGQRAVYAIDEQSETVDYFPFDQVEAFAKSHGQEATMAAFHTGVEAMLKQQEAAQQTVSVSGLLARMNEPAQVEREHRKFYYGLLSLGDAASQPGADLNGGWYLRNAKIFAKLGQIAKPGDRVLVIFGSGHGYWLRHFARETPGFELVETVEYLR